MRKVHLSDKKIYKKTICVLIVAVIYVIGLVVSSDYGRCWDEPAEMKILMSNMAEYVYDLLPEDSDSYKYYRESGTTGISQSVERDHGEATYYPIAYFLRKSESLKQKSDIWHYYSFTVFFIGTLALLYILLNVLNCQSLAALLVFSYFFTPRLFAQSHYNNKDTVLLSLLLVLCAVFLSLSKKQTLPKTLFASLVAALIINNKILGAWFVLVLALMFVFLSVKDHAAIKSVFFVLIFGILGTMVFYYLLTPAMWHDPYSFVLYLTDGAKNFARWKGYVRFRGSNYVHDGYPLPKYYIPYIFIITTPLYVLAYLIIGHLMAVWNTIKRDERAITSEQQIIAISMILIWIFPLAYAVISGMNVYNDWRHFYFMYGPMIITSACGLDSVMTKKNVKAVAMVLLGIFNLYFIVTCYIYHPYQYCYYNILAGCNVENEYELDYWNVSIEDALTYILNSDRSDVICITASDENTKRGIEDALEIVDGSNRLVLLYDIINEWKGADYIVVNTTYDHIYGR